MKLSIVIGVNKKRLAGLARTLYSIEAQVGVDLDAVEVVIAYPAALGKAVGQVYAKSPVSFNATIATVSSENPWLVLQNGLDESSGEFVSFMEAGDLWTDQISLLKITEALSSNDAAECLSFGSLAETVLPPLEATANSPRHPASVAISPLADTSDWIYGRGLSRSFIERAGLRFLGRDDINEGQRWNGLIDACAPVSATSPDNLYFRRDTITLPDPADKPPKLSIIVPYFNEEPRLLYRALYSIEAQASIRFSAIEVIVCIDAGGNKDIAKLAARIPWSFKLRFINRKAAGGSPGLNRNNGIDHAAGKYVMFMDSDDSLATQTALAAVLNALFDTPVLVRGQIAANATKGGKPLVGIQPVDRTWVHAKIFSLDYINSHKIRFSEDIMYNEDVYFVNRFVALDAPVKPLNEPIYLWRRREDSVTRQNGGAFNEQYFADYIRAIREANEGVAPYAEKRLIMTSTAVYGFIMINSPQMRKPENAEYKAAAEWEFQRFIDAHYDELLSGRVLRQCFADSVKGNVDSLQFNISYDSWIRRFRNKR